MLLSSLLEEYHPVYWNLFFNENDYRYQLYVICVLKVCQLLEGRGYRGVQFCVVHIVNTSSLFLLDKYNSSVKIPSLTKFSQ